MHEHRWEPEQGLCGQYRCAECSVTGYRHYSGQIRQHRQPPERKVMATARGRLANDGAVPARIEEDWTGRDKKED